jgi:uncharacterized protein (DUF488 family)
VKDPVSTVAEKNLETNSIYTIGHSTHSFEKFLKMLDAFFITMVVDVRTIPKSRHNPQFNIEELKRGLEAHRVGYIHLVGLGGLRRTKKHSVNTGWKNPSFRGYADYMQTSDFENSLAQLIKIAGKKMTAIMCAEAVPWRCHRYLIGDALLVHGFKIQDILNDKTSVPHKLTPWARVDGYTITYPGD